MDRYDSWDEDLKYFQDAKNSSIKTQKQEELISVSSGKKKNVFKKFALVAISCIFVVIIVGSGIAVKGWADNNVRDNQITRFLEENYDVLEPNTHRQPDGTLWYSTSNIASDIEKYGAGDRDLAVYSAYRQMDYKTKMDEVIIYLYDEKYDTFDQWLTSKGYVDEEGKPSREKYNEAMEEETLKQMQTLSEQQGIKK